VNAEGKKRSIISAVIAVIIVAFIYFLVPATQITPQGILLPVKNVLSALPPQQVVFYDKDNLPLAYQKIGYLNVQFHSQSVTTQSEKQLEAYVRQMAASAGANGVVVYLFGHTLLGQVPASQASYVFRGLAVYAVPNI